MWRARRRRRASVSRRSPHPVQACRPARRDHHNMHSKRCRPVGLNLQNGRPVRLLVAMLVLLIPIGFIAGPAGAAPNAVTAVVANSRLTVTGTDGPDQIALRLRSGDATMLEVDAGINGTADFSFNRATFTAIDVNLNAGADLAWIDDVNGVFTDLEVTTVNGGIDADVIQGGAGPETLIGGAGDDAIDGGLGRDKAL